MTRARSVDLTSPFPADLTGMCELLLIRHGEQRFFDGMTMADALDPPLTEMGERQATAVGERLAPAAIDAVYSSTMERARRTGEAIAGHHDLTVDTRDELREIDPWQSFPQDKQLTDVYSIDELKEIFSAVHATRRFEAYPHTEDPDAFRSRVVEAIDAIGLDHLGQRVAVACHGGVIGAYLSRCFESAVDHVVAVHHTSITTVRLATDPVRRAVISVNDFGHVLSFQSQRNPLNAH